MRNEKIFPSTEIKNQSPMDNKRNKSQKKNFNKSNISKILQNPKNIFNFLFKIEENTILSNFNKSTAASFNNINLINNIGLNKNLIRNQLKYIQMTDDFIDNKIKSNMNNPNNGSEYQYMKIINNIFGVQKNASYNQKFLHPIDNYNFIYNKSNSNFNKTTNNNNKQNSPRNLQNQEKLDLSSFSTTIGGNIPHSYSNSNKANINTHYNNNHFMNNIENESKGSKQLKMFKIGKKEDFIISPMNGDINSSENKNKEKIILDNTKRAESPTSIRTFITESSNSGSTGTNSMPSNRVLVEYNNRIKNNNNIKKSPPKNINKSPTLSKVMFENSKIPQNNSRKKKNKLEIKIDENKNNINNNNNIIKNSRINMVGNNINNKLNIFTNITPRNKVVKKIKINMDEANIKERSKSPIQINYHQKDNSFISPFRNKEYSNLSENERDQSYKHNKINYSNIDMNKSRNRNEYIKSNNINSYTSQMLKKKKKIIKLNQYNNSNNSDININYNRCITNENKKDTSREHTNQIRKSPTSINPKSKIIIKKEINEKNLPKNNSNRIKTKIVQKKILDKEKVINNIYSNNVNNTNNVNNINKIYNKENNYSNKITNKQILTKNLKNEDVKNKKESFDISNLKNNNNFNIVKESNIKNDNKSIAENIVSKEVQIITEKKENKEFKENNNNTNNNVKNSTKKKKKPKKKVFNIDLTEENTDNKNNIKDDNTHSEDISDKSLSEDNKPQIYDFDQIYEKREIEPNNFDNRQNLSKNFFCSFGQKDYKEENDNNKNEIKKEYSDPVSAKLKLLNELKEKIKERNEKKLENFSNDSINNNKEGIYKSNELERIIKSYSNNSNDINKKSLIKPYSNPNYQFNIKEENQRSGSEENNKNKIDDYKEEIKDKIYLSNNYKSLDKKSYKTNETGNFGTISNEKIEQYNNNNFDIQSFGEKESNINQSSENKISNYTKDEYENNINQGKEDQFKLSFKINSDLCDSEFNDIKYLEDF